MSDELLHDGVAVADGASGPVRGVRKAKAGAEPAEVPSMPAADPGLDAQADPVPRQEGVRRVRGKGPRSAVVSKRAGGVTETDNARAWLLLEAVDAYLEPAATDATRESVHKAVAKMLAEMREEAIRCAVIRMRNELAGPVALLEEPKR